MPHDVRAVLEAEHRHAPGVEREQRSTRRRQRQPAGGKYAQEMPVRHERYVAAAEHRQHARENAVGPPPDVRRSLTGLTVSACGHAVSPKRPAGQQRSDLRRRQPFVTAVVPLDEVGVGLDMLQPGELRGFLRATQRTRENKGEAAVGDQAGHPLRLLLTEQSQRDVGATGVLATRAPLGGAMP